MERKGGDRAHDLAVRIYVELVGRNTELSQDSVKLTASATNMANLSLKLSQAFLEAEEMAAGARPAKAHDFSSEDMAKWTK